MVFYDICPNETYKAVLEKYGEKIYKKHLETTMNMSKERYGYSSCKICVSKSIRSFEEGTFYKNKETDELEGYILVRDSMFLREKEILLLVSVDLTIMFKLLRRFVRNTTRNDPAIIYSYIMENEEILQIYLDLGFFIEKRSPKLFHGDVDLILMRFNNHSTEAVSTDVH